MALNLNKGDEQSSKPSTEKKGLNLSKSADTSKVKQNLSKDNPLPTDRSQSSNPKQRESKRIPSLTIIFAVFIIGLGVFWYMNNNEITNVAQSDLENSSAVVSEDAVTPTSLSEDQQALEPVKAIDNSSDETNEQLSKSNDNNVQEATSENAYNSNTSQASRIASTSSSSQLQGTIEEKARQVISGAFGNGADRKKSLGDEYAAIQAKVNELYNVRLNN